VRFGGSLFVKHVPFVWFCHVAKDVLLIILEWAQIVDTSNHWSYGTMKTYNSSQVQCHLGF
jgi:hypothetical protein